MSVLCNIVSFLKKNTTIQRSLALVLIIVFAISITPRLFLHDIFAGHIDSSHHCNADGKSMGCIHTPGYSCQQDSPVVNSSYHSPAPAGIPEILTVYVQHQALLYSSFPSSLDNVKENRGPPQAV